MSDDQIQKSIRLIKNSVVSTHMKIDGINMDVEMIKEKLDQAKACMNIISNNIRALESVIYKGTESLRGEP